MASLLRLTVKINIEYLIEHIGNPILLKVGFKTSRKGEKMDYMKVLTDLISIDTSVPPGKNFEQAIDLLEPLLSECYSTIRQFVT